MKKRVLPLLLSLVLACSMAAPAAALELDKAKQLLEQYYVDTIPEEVLTQTSLEELLAALGDPYTIYYSAEEYQSFLSSVNGESIVGIGISIQVAYNDGFEVLSVLNDSPAQEAGWEAGDVIVGVDGVPVTASTEIRSLISGPEGTSLTISLRRGATGQVEEFTLTRRTVLLPIVTYEQLDSIGFIDCTSFGQSTAATVEEALTTLGDDVSVWVMDLSANSGGTASSAASTASQFTGGGTMVYFLYANGGYQYMYTHPSYAALTDKPLILLLGPYSASAAELFAGDIRDYQAGIAVGQRSYGKGIAQNVMDSSNYPDLFDGDALKITTSRFFSPSGTTNHLVGVLPSLLVSPEHTADVAALLSLGKPERAHNHVKLELAGQTFYINLTQATSEEYKAAFIELLEALPPSAKLYRGFTYKWGEITPHALADLLRITYTSRSYNDIADSPYAYQINTLAAYQLLPNHQDLSFHPTQSMTRGEFCSMVATALDLPSNPEALTFSDVPSDSPYAEAISAMVTRGFISGHGDGTFSPDDELTIEAAVCVLWRAAEWLSMNASALSEDGPNIEEWLNYYEFADWAENAAWRLEQLGVSVRYTAPGETVTREVAAAMLCELMECTNLFWN